MNPTDTPLAPFLDSGEKLLWSGQPKQKLQCQASDWLMVPLSLVGACLAFGWEIIMLGVALGARERHPAEDGGLFVWLFPLFGLPFVLMAFYQLYGRFFVDAATRMKTWYGVTDRRLIILRVLFPSKVSSFDANNLSNLHLVERGDRSGDIVFGLPTPTPFWGHPWPGLKTGSSVPGFYLLPEARKVYNLIRETQQAARRP